MRRLALLFIIGIGCGGSEPATECLAREVCANAIDDDCDGAVDEGCDCRDERCDGVLDDNCDGVVDEGCDCTDGAERRCAEGTDVGACFSGIERCTEGTWQPCQGRIDPIDEQCNGVDDDCDGESDGAAAAAASCEVVPHAVGSSCAGHCAPTCETGFEDCNGEYADGCETDLGVSASCGACGVQCLAGEFCELGTCTSLPAIVWAAPLGPNQPYDMALDDDGTMYLASEIQTPITIGGQTISSPTNNNQAHLLSAQIDLTGTPQWMRVDGTNTGASGVAFFEGTFYVAGGGTTTFDSITVGPKYLVAFDAVGAVQWGASLADLSNIGVGRPIVGPFGVDIVDAGNLRRFEHSGNELAAHPVPPGEFRRANLQLADGSTVVRGQSNSSLSASCAALPDTTVTHYFARIAPDGACSIVTAFAVSPGVFISGVRADSNGGFLAFGSLSFNVQSGTLTSGSFAATITSPGTFTVTLDAQFQPVSASQNPVGFFTDSRGNSYSMQVSTSGSPFSTFVRSFRPDGVLRWELEFVNVAGPTPGTTFAVNRDGFIGLSTAAAGDPPTLNGVVLPMDPLGVLVLEGK